MTLALLMATLIIAPLGDAVERISQRTPVGSKLRTADWERVPLALRERSQFSAATEEMRVLHTVQDGMSKLASQTRNAAGVRMDRSKLIAQIGQVARDAGLTPTDPKLIGSIQDITGERRAELIVDTQTQMAYGYANWKAGQDEDALDAFPAQELIRVEERKDKRDWRRRWLEAGGKLVGGERMIALKSDGVWEKISRFGTPWPPYDFGSGMGVEDVSREEAIEFGLIKPAETVPPNPEDFNESLSVSKTGVGDEGWRWLKESFGDQVRFDGDRIVWHGKIIQELYDNAMERPGFTGSTRLGKATAKTVRVGSSSGADLSGAQLHLTADDIRHANRRHGARARQLGQPPLTKLDFEMVPHVWRDPDAVLKGAEPGTWVFRKRFGEDLYSVVWKRSQAEGPGVYGIHTMYKRKPA